MNILPVWLNENYLVFPDGRVLSIKRNKFLKQSLSNNSGYLMYGSKIGSVHRLIAHCFLGGIPKDKVVNHLDGNKLNNSLSNLEICSISDNVRHAYNNGLIKKMSGENNHQAKITKDQLFKIYDLFNKGKSNKEIGQLFNLHDRYVSLIRHGRRWLSVYNEYIKANGLFPVSDFKNEDDIAFDNKKAIAASLFANKSNTEIAKILEVDTSTVSRWRTGKTRVSNATTIEIAAETQKE